MKKKNSKTVSQEITITWFLKNTEDLLGCRQIRTLKKKA